MIQDLSWNLGNHQHPTSDTKCHKWTKGNVDDYHLTPEQVNKCIKINHLYRLRSYTISH